MNPSDQPKMASMDWAQAKFDALKEDADEAKVLALSAKRKAEAGHNCNQVKVIEEMKAKIDGWTKWWKATMVTLIAGIIAVVSFLWSVNDRADEVEDGVQDVRESVEKVTNKVTTVMDAQKKMQTTIDRQDIVEEAKDRDLHFKLKKALKEVLTEDKRNSPKRRKVNP